MLEPIETIQRMVAVLDRMLQPQGYNIGLNQGHSAVGLPGHLHWHIVPRWDGDTNFMPVLGQTKVIVESLQEFYDRFITELGQHEDNAYETGLAPLVVLDSFALNILPARLFRRLYLSRYIAMLLVLVRAVFVLVVAGLGVRTARIVGEHQLANASCSSSESCWRRRPLS